MSVNNLSIFRKVFNTRSNPFILGVLLILLSGCSFNAKGPLFNEVVNDSNEKALVYVYRDDERAPYRVPVILINNKPSGRLKNKGYFKLSLSAGEYTIQTQWPKYITITSAKSTFQFEAGKTYYIHTSINQKVDGQIFTGDILRPYIPNTIYFSVIQLKNKPEAIQQLKNCRQIHPAAL